MTTNNHPIEPSSKLIQQWMTEIQHVDISSAYYYAIAQSAQWGADQELEACCEWLERDRAYAFLAAPLHKARRFKPPNLKAQALRELDRLEKVYIIDVEVLNTMRSALEAT